LKASEQPALPAPGTEARPSAPRAGFWIRLGAVLVDGVPLALVSFGIGSAFGTGGNLLGLVIGLAYYTYFEGSASGQTVGKRLCGIRVVDVDGRRSIGYARAATRYLMSYVSGFALLLGYLWMLWDSEKQTWHDKVANSVVVPVSAVPVERWPG
jgi:uncharacterized RDD family membrane protein YckC